MQRFGGYRDALLKGHRDFLVFLSSWEAVDNLFILYLG